MIIKSVTIIFFLASLILLLGCDEFEDMIKFNIHDKTSIRIEGGSGLNLPIEVSTPDVTTNSQQQFENNNTRADLVKDVKLEQLKFTITNPDGKTFSFLKSIKMFISTDQSAEIELASLDNIESMASTIELVPTTQKLDAYIKSSAYNLRTEVTTRETLTQNVDIEIDLKFLVTANAF